MRRAIKKINNSGRKAAVIKNTRAAEGGSKDLLVAIAEGITSSHSEQRS